jgi:hypothetical protein
MAEDWKLKSMTRLGKRSEDSIEPARAVLREQAEHMHAPDRRSSPAKASCTQGHFTHCATAASSNGYASAGAVRPIAPMVTFYPLGAWTMKRQNL